MYIFYKKRSDLLDFFISLIYLPIVISDHKRLSFFFFIPRLNKSYKYNISFNNSSTTFHGEDEKNKKTLA